MTAMFHRVAYRPRTFYPNVLKWQCQYGRSIATDSRNRLSKFWAPTGGISPQDEEPDESHALLVQGGFLRQAHSGVFHLLPLGLRVQNKLEFLIDKHMQSIGASKVSMSSITTEDLWKQSGRYSANSELLRIKDRRESGFLLSPTHEEEITALVASMIHSYKDLPLRLYQTGRKYRDERRPRQGLLRAKEFMMKDLYTFDCSSEAALKTYDEVRKAYDNLFNELGLPYLVADADSGNMGGKLSHEYHFVSKKGEDNVWSCNSCSYVANEELVDKKSSAAEGQPDELVFQVATTDKKTLVNIHIPRPSSLSAQETPSNDQISSFINQHAVKRALPDYDLNFSHDPTFDPPILSTLDLYDRAVSTPNTNTNASSHDLTLTRTGDSCPRCFTGTLSVQKAIEVGHTFHLGTRYSEPLAALVAIPTSPAKVAMQMGCHGIGVSRIIGAVASLLADARGLNWPRAIAPYEVAVLATPGIDAGDVEGVYDALVRRGDEEKVRGNGDEYGNIDVVMDDREGKRLGWKLKDADIIGYPVVVVLGRGWKESREVEVQCRLLGVKKQVQVENVREQVEGLLKKL